VTGLVTAGKARAWGVVNWGADAVADVSAVASRLGRPQPCAAQLPYSLVQRAPVEDDRMVAALRDCRASVVASFVLAGGVLTGKYDADPGTGRAAGTLHEPRVAGAAAAGSRLRELAVTAGASPAALAIAFTLANPTVASGLFGATTPDQVRQNVAALETADALADALMRQLEKIGVPDA